MEPTLVRRGLFVAPYPDDGSGWRDLGESVDPLTFGYSRNEDEPEGHPEYGPDHHALGKPCPFCAEDGAL